MKRIVFILAAMLAVAACGNKIEPEEGGQKPGTGNGNGTEIPDPQPGLEGNIRGQITDSTTGAPIAGVSVSDGYTAVVFRLKVIHNTEGSTNFILSCITFAYRAGIIIIHHKVF